MTTTLKRIDSINSIRTQRNELKEHLNSFVIPNLHDVTFKN